MGTYKYQFHTHKCKPNAHPLVKRLVQEMNSQRVSATYVCERAGVTTNSISKWKNNKRIFDINSIEACFNVLGLTITVKAKKGE